jgi:hypothetical protein
MSSTSSSPVNVLRRKHNEELLVMLEDEQRRETERKAALARCKTDAERARLEVIFSEERTRSSEHILALSNLHEKELQQASD